MLRSFSCVEEKMKNKKKIILFGIIGLMILFGGILLGKSYAIFETDTISKSAVTIKVGTINLF